MSSGLLDTGIFIATEGKRPLGQLARESDPIPISESVMSAWAHLVDDCRRAGIHRTLRLTDALIAATAIAHGLPVITQDAHFDRMADAHKLLQVVMI